MALLQKLLCQGTPILCKFPSASASTNDCLETYENQTLTVTGGHLQSQTWQEKVFISNELQELANGCQKEAWRCAWELLLKTQDGERRNIV